ncbi:hypothetical protein [uncultured Clostridium sp.]|uniref:hypothetical protein n=1 Tax=uncultured Clostridium sp. TaxID=59620 RepID=UPI0025F7676E|nr:hypothetical protein [uncultured Clostridium sp.]
MNKYIYIIGTICVLFVVATLFIKMLPFLIVTGVILYLAVGLKGKIKSLKKNEKINNTYGGYNNSNDDVQDMYNSSDDYTNGEIIDVDDYEDVDKK